MQESKSSRELLEESKAFFDRRFAKHNFGTQPAYQKKYQFVLSCLDITPDDMVADIGCAQGGVLLICRRSGIQAYGVDFSHEALKVAKQSGLDNIICADAQRLPFRDNLFDKIIALQTIEVVPNTISALDEIHRIGKVDATVYLDVRNGSFILRPFSKFTRHVFRRLAKDAKPDLLFNEDPPYNKWTEMLHERGYKILRTIKTPVYLCYENPVQFIKTIALTLVYWLCPARYCFTVSFVCKKRW